jgi:soluble lytic murein transglycosylase-like protein
MVTQARPVSAQDVLDFEKMVDRISGEQGVESPLVHSVIRAESNYNPNAVSPKGALGLMQLIPATARRFGVSNAFDAQENIQGGVRYLRFLLDYYRGDYAKAIAAYNAGEAAVDKYHGIPPYAETRSYVSRVARNLKVARQNRVDSTPPAAARLATETAKLETSRPIQASVGSDGRIYYRTP